MAIVPPEEVATFCDVNQFQPGKTGYACGYYAVRLVAAAAPYGQPPRSSPAQIIGQAEADYAYFDGSNGANNRDGMTLSQLYDDLKLRGLSYYKLPCTVSAILAQLKQRRPVLLSVAETSVYDVALGRCPYDAWQPSGYHIILATGAQLDTYAWCRDTANVLHDYALRPGPRRYDLAKMQIMSATAVLLPFNEPAPAPVAPALLSAGADDLQVWHLLKPEVPLVAQNAIPQSWLRGRWQHGYNFGPVLEAEHEVEREGVALTEQQFTAARASYSPKTGQVTWWTASGKVTI